jgi:hypothetical protein
VTVQVTAYSNGICERFHKTIGNEFYAVAFRRTVYTSLAQLQADLDVWLEEYNTQRTHQGKYCYGKTPQQTLLDGCALAQEKQVTHHLARHEQTANVLEQGVGPSRGMTDGLGGQRVGVGQRSEPAERPLTSQAVIYTEATTTQRPQTQTPFANRISHGLSDTVR